MFSDICKTVTGRSCLELKTYSILYKCRLVMLSLDSIASSVTLRDQHELPLAR